MTKTSFTNAQNNDITVFPESTVFVHCVTELLYVLKLQLQY